MDSRANALLELAMVGVLGSLHVMRIMAGRGLVSPTDVEEFAEGITAHFDAPSEPDEFALAIRSIFEATTAPLLADMRERARRNWPGDDTSSDASSR